jgi:light-regulated signal transduction histidine kinase (bacteriophytochrome)
MKASKRMNMLINDLLKFSRNSVQQKDFRFINLNELVKEVLLDVEVEIERSNASIEIQQLPHVWGVPIQMQQLFQNLISNALKFARKDVRPVIRMFADTARKDELLPNSGNYYDEQFNRIFIEDNGIGFDQKYADEIFVVFKRLHSYHDFEGTGVGLSICKKIVESHNGFIRAESKINEGTRFVIYLPQQVEHLVSLA